MTIKWQTNTQNLNINDIIKVLDILPCDWADGYGDYDNNNHSIPTPEVDGNNLIYAVSDIGDGYFVRYYKCSADGTILEIGRENYDDEED